MSKKQIEVRKLMERAIEVMRQSVPEPRTDGKVDPKVGAVLCKSDGTVIGTACRGELRHGDHAEFTLLERKNRANKLDGSILFATLEPCAKGARNHPKLSCSERIFLARIKEVWIGIQDPDPTVARKGIGYLIRQGMTVHMFDRDLQDIIERENKEFLEQATERADDVKKMPAKVMLSPLEDKLPEAKLSDFSRSALDTYRQKAEIAHPVSSEAFNLRLLRQGILKREHGVLVPTGFGFLLFGKEPRTMMRQAGLLAIIHYPNGDKERHEFDEPAVLIPDMLEKWLKSKLPNVFDRDQMHRQERAALPFEIIREAVANALIHRDYSIDGAKCQIEVTEDTVTVQSPGKPPPPISLEQLQDFSAPMLSRNPELHFVFARMGMAEEQGLGLSSLRDRAKELGLPIPKFVWKDPYLILTLYRSAKAAVRTLDEDQVQAMSKTEVLGWEFLAARTGTTQNEYAKNMSINARTAQRHLAHFVELGLMRRVGRGPATEYIKT